MLLAYGNPRNFRNISRYGIYRQITVLDTGETYLESFNKTHISKDGNTYHIVQSSEIDRLDIISNMYYGTPTLAWVIAEANNIIDPLVLSQGTVLKIPEYSSLYKTGGPLVRRG